MDKKSKVLILIFLLLLFGSVAMSFYKIVIKMDYLITLETECDPAVNACFIFECSPEDDSECPENEAERISYYQILTKKAYNFPNCDFNENCPQPTCAEGETDCEITFCDETTKEEDQQCSNPTDFQAEQVDEDDPCAENATEDETNTVEGDEPSEETDDQTESKEKAECQKTEPLDEAPEQNDSATD